MIRFSWLALLLVPAAYVVERTVHSALVTFIIAAAAILPLADWIRRATEQVAGRAGAAVGGLLNVTFGNAAEFILGLFVLAAGHAPVVKAQITGAMIGNSLLGLGAVIIAGTWRADNATFKRERASLLSSLLLLSTIALLLPALFDYTERAILPGRNAHPLDERLSLGVAVVLVVVYVANLVYTMCTHRDVFAFEEHKRQGGQWPLWQGLAALAAATAATAFMAELVSNALQGSAATMGVSPFFLGVTVLAVVGNVAEYVSALYFARRGRMGLAMTITVGSTVQVALLVAPLLVLVSWMMARPMDLVFENPLELIAIAGAAFMVHAIASDGETTWFEGALLIAVYALFGLSFFFVTPA